MRASAAAAALAVLLGAAAASAAGATTQRFFQSPSKNIECELDHRTPGVGTGAYCQTFTRAQSVTLSASGSLTVCSGRGCLGNGPENETTLGYGSSVVLGPFRCTSLEAGVRCTIASGRGFLISRTGVAATVSGEPVHRAHR